MNKEYDCIRDMDKRIIALLAMMSDREVAEFLKAHISEGAHLSVIKRR